MAKRASLVPCTAGPGGNVENDGDIFAAFIEERVGIRTRRVVDRDAIVARTPHAGRQVASDLGALAARRALDARGLSPRDIDVLLCGTSTPDRLFPSTAVEVQAKLRSTNGWACDVPAACASFAFALLQAHALITSGQAHRVLVLSAEYFTCGVDYEDPTGSYFWGDGAAAALVEASSHTDGFPGYGLLASVGRTQPSQSIRTGMGGTIPHIAGAHWGAVPTKPGDDAYPYFWQDGPRVYREVAPLVSEAIRDLLQAAGQEPHALQALFLHQANAIMIDGIVKRLFGTRAPDTSIPRNYEEYGNTSSAGVGIALADAPRPEAGSLACLCGFGAGYSLAALLLVSV